MNSLSAIDAPSAAEARRILRSTGSVRGTNQRFFERVVSLMGSDPGASRELASRWQVFSKYGDDPAFAIRAKAVAERIAGKWASAGESFLAAGRLASNPVDREVFSIGAVDSFARAGDVQRAVRLGRRIAGKLGSLGKATHAGRARLNLGNALLYVDDYSGAAREYQVAADLLRGTPYERDAAAAELGFSGAELFGGSVSESAQAAGRAAQAFERLGDGHYADLARLNLAHCHLMQGRGDEAREVLLEIAPRLTDSPADAARCEEFLGDAYLRLNLFEESLDAYSAALVNRQIRRMPLNLATATFGLGLAQTAMGRAVPARKSLRKSARMFGRLGNLPWQGAALSAEADVSKGKRAEELLAKAIATLKRAKSRYHLCLALLSHGERFGDAKSLRAAEKLIAQNGYGFLRWRVDASKARKSRGATRLGHWRRMFESLLEERLLTRSTSSRSVFFRDKHSPLAEYLGDLLVGGQPKVEEALSVVSRSRSSALIDELLAVERPQLSAEAREALEALRTAIAEGSTTPQAGGSRRRPAMSPSIPRLQRHWEETDYARAVWGASELAAHRHDVAVFAETNEGYYCLFEGRAIPLEIDTARIETLVRRLEFDLLAPMVGLKDIASTEASLAAGRELVDRAFVGRAPHAIVPDGPLWGLPWPALVDFEPVLHANPAFVGNMSPAKLSRVVVWAHDPGDLPNISGEVNAVLKHFPNAEVVDTLGEARKSLLKPIDLLHVACHSTTRPENPMYSSLELRDGMLMSVDIAKSSGTTKLVTLSACDTGRVSLRIRSEPDGLVRSFLALGADAVVASLWPLDDSTAAKVMGTYYRSLLRTLDVRTSLAEARSRVRKHVAHPYFWAPLTIFGGYSSAL